MKFVIVILQPLIGSFQNKVMKFKSSLFREFFRPILFISAFILLCSHNLYLKLESYFLTPNQEVTLNLFNGSFEKSENTITRDRILDASIIYNGKREQIEDNQWTDKDSTITRFSFTPVEEGTYITGVSTKARTIALTAEKFNSYLEHDGVLDMLEARKTNNLLNQDAVESYEKHVKAIYQVGDTKTKDWETVLEYPIEFVPQENPYEKYTGETLDIKLLLDGEPLSNQLVFADYIKGGHAHDHSEHSDDGHSHPHDKDSDSHSHEQDDASHSHEDQHDEHAYQQGKEKHSHSHDHKENYTQDHQGDKALHSHKHSDEENHTHDTKAEESHIHTSAQQLRTNDQGIVSVDLPEDGMYYLRTIHMVNLADSDELTHKSKWATLSFEVTHKHGEDIHTHGHEHEGGIPTWMFIVGSLIVIVVLFFAFRKNK